MYLLLLEYDFGLLLQHCLQHSHSLILGVGLGCRVRRLGSRWMQSSTSSVRPSIRRTWKTFSERPPKELWPSIANTGTTRGRRNVWFCEVKSTGRGVRTSLYSDHFSFFCFFVKEPLSHIGSGWTFRGQRCSLSEQMREQLGLVMRGEETLYRKVCTPLSHPPKSQEQMT